MKGSSSMTRVQDVTLAEAYKHVQKSCFGLWKIKGNYMNIETPPNTTNAETLVFLGESIFILGLSVEKKGFGSMGSKTDFIDIWPSVRIKYPQLFQDGLKGDLYLIP